MAEEKNLNIYQKLSKIRDTVDVVKKSKKGFNYTYSDITEILAKVRAMMTKYNVLLCPQFVHGSEQVQSVEFCETKIDNSTKTPYEKKTTEMMVKTQMNFEWINIDNPDDKYVVPWLMVGSQSDVSQALGSGLTYTTRQFLTNFFQIAQDNDVDTFRTKQKEASEAEDRALAASIIEEFDKAVRAFLNDNKDKAEDIKKFVKKYEPSSNYHNIKKPDIAAALFNEFNDTYLKEEK